MESVIPLLIRFIMSSFIAGSLVLTWLVEYVRGVMGQSRLFASYKGNFGGCICSKGRVCRSIYFYSLIQRLYYGGSCSGPCRLHQILSSTLLL